MKSGSRHRNKDSSSHRSMKNFESECELFLTFRDSDDGVCLLKSCKELRGSLPSQGFHSSLCHPQPFSQSLWSHKISAEPLPLSTSLWMTPPTSTPSLSATICPTLPSHHSFPPSKPININSHSPPRLTSLPQLPSLSDLCLPSLAMFYAL